MQLIDVALLTQVLEVQGLTFFLLAVVRPAHFALVFSFFAKYGFKHYGKLVGAAQTSIGITNQLQFALLALAAPDEPGGPSHFQRVNYVFLSMSIIGFLFVWLIKRRGF